MNNPLEAVLFESTIVGIDFSRWQQSVDLTVLSAWDCFDGHVFPVFELKKIRFKNTRRFLFDLPENHPDTSGTCRAIRVDGASIKKTGSSWHIAMQVETHAAIEVVCSGYEIEKIGQDIQERFMRDFKKHGKIEFLPASSWPAGAY